MSATSSAGSRRDLVRRGLALGGAVLGGTAFGLLSRAGRAAAASQSADAALVGPAIELERRAAAIYEAGLASGLLETRTRELAVLLGGQSREHAERLLEALGDLGASISARPVPEAGGRASEAAFLDAAISLEAAAVAAYLEAIGRLEDGGLLRLAGQIMTVDAQHLVVLREAAGRRPLSGALVTGASQRQLR